MINKTDLIFRQSKSGIKPFSVVDKPAKSKNIRDVIPNHLLRDYKPELPEVSESQVVRHYTNLSIKNHHVDKNFYPLGSCTMKYNPKINDSVALQSGFANVHPNQDDLTTQGIIKVYHDLEKSLCELTGMDRTTLQPSAGSQGELVGLLLMKKYHEKQKNNKEYVVIPETAHGTNPASVIMAGYKVKQVKSNNRGRVDIEHLKEIVDENVAGMMLTQPNTLGLFEDQISEIVSIIHSFDGLMYMDGANLNAIVGVAKPALMGFDIMHINLHKTFSTPHGGGGPGAGPVAVNKKLVNFLPSPMPDFDEKNKKYFFNYDMPDSIGRVHSFNGNFGILVRALTYITILGKDGLKRVAQLAVLNANYLKEILSEYYDIPNAEGSLHEFVISAVKQKDQGLKALDIGKSLLDYGFHAPTIYFPINIPESIMIEPTETESKQTLDSFADAMIQINNCINSNLDYLKNSPHNTPVRRLDETTANRNLDVNYSNEK